MYNKGLITVCVLALQLWFGGCSSVNSGDLEEPVASSSSAEIASSSSSSVALSSSSEMLPSSSSTAPITGTFTDDRDGYTYKIVQIGTQVWMAENLRYLPSVNGTDYSYDDPKYYVYGYDGTDVSAAKATDNYSKYGALYNWPAAMTACPAGWHLPTDAEWTVLEDYVGGRFIAGKKLKSTSGWTAYSGIVNEDAYGFGALPGGDFFSGDFYDESGYGYWWSATEYNASGAYRRYLRYFVDYVTRYNYGKNQGFSVRCVHDATVAPSSSSSSATAPITGTFIDTRDGTTYKYVQIGTQTWMAENLRYLPSLNGTTIGYTIPKYYVNNYTGTDVTVAKSTTNYQTYGALYNWQAALTACPAGWHLPTNAEWTTLENFVGGSSTAGQKLKATSGWTDSGNGTDAYGFGALPGGSIMGCYFDNDGSCFNQASNYGYWWSATEYGPPRAHAWYLRYEYDYMRMGGQFGREYGYSVRCVMN